MTAILGLNSYHGDASACVVVDGVLRSAAEEERFRRVKHWAGFPSKAIESCIMEAGIGLSDIDHIAINSDPKANRLGKIAYTLSGRANPSLVLEKLITRGRRNNPIDELEKRFPDCTINANIHRVEHHLAHLGSCFLVSPYREAVCVSVDGFGDFSSAAWGFGREAIVEVDGKVGFPHSLGVFYQAMTQYLGFPRYGDEYKVMGLAAHGEPMYMDAMRDIVKTQADGTYRLDLSYFRHQRHEIGYEWADGAPDVSRLYSEKLEALVGPAREQDDPLTKRYKDLARSVQTMYEDALFHLLNHLYERYQVDTLTLSGGCAFNSVANGNVTSLTPFKRVYIQPAAGDAGGAIGAAYVAWHRLNGGARSFVMDHAYWGPAFSKAEIGQQLERCKRELCQHCCAIEELPDQTELCERVAGAIAAGKVIGWFQGRMEWGPRALGNRSILCDPRRAEMRDILNIKIKIREEFRPFAPSILREAVSEWFEIDGDVPFMTEVFPIRKEKRSQIPAVTHADGSGRLQSVQRDTNPRFYRLIETFGRITGIPMVLNTSFNENEPIVCTPGEALTCFLRSGMDVLVLGDYVIERSVH